MVTAALYKHIPWHYAFVRYVQYVFGTRKKTIHTKHTFNFQICFPCSYILLWKICVSLETIEWTSIFYVGIRGCLIFSIFIMSPTYINICEIVIVKIVLSFNLTKLNFKINLESFALYFSILFHFQFVRKKTSPLEMPKRNPKRFDIVITLFTFSLKNYLILIHHAYLSQLYTFDVYF